MATQQGIYHTILNIDAPAKSSTTVQNDRIAQAQQIAADSNISGAYFVIRLDELIDSSGAVDNATIVKIIEVASHLRQDQHIITHIQERKYGAVDANDVYVPSAWIGWNWSWYNSADGLTMLPYWNTGFATTVGGYFGNIADILIINDSRFRALGWGEWDAPVPVAEYSDYATGVMNAATAFRAATNVELAIGADDMPNSADFDTVMAHMTGSNVGNVVTVLPNSNGEFTIGETTPPVGNGESRYADLFGNWWYGSGPGSDAATRLQRADSAFAFMLNHPWNPTERTGFRGIGFRGKWKAIEPSEGSITGEDINNWKAHLVKAHNRGLKVFFTIEDLWFNSSAGPSSNYLPSYMQSSGSYGGNASNPSYQAKLWDASIMDKFIAMHKKVYDELKDYPGFAGFETVETTRAYSADGQNFSNVSDAYKVQFVRFVTELANYMDIKHVVSPHINYCVGNGDVDLIPSIVDELRPLTNVILNSPDAVYWKDPARPNAVSYAIDAYNEFRSEKDVQVIGINAQTRELTTLAKLEDAYDMLFHHPTGDHNNINPSLVMWYDNDWAVSGFNTRLLELIEADNWDVYQSTAESIGTATPNVKLFKVFRNGKFYRRMHNGKAYLLAKPA